MQRYVLRMASKVGTGQGMSWPGGSYGDTGGLGAAMDETTGVCGKILCAIGAGESWEDGRRPKDKSSIIQPVPPRKYASKLLTTPYPTCPRYSGTDASIFQIKRKNTHGCMIMLDKSMMT